MKNKYTPTVFIVDDEASIREMLELMVASGGYTSRSFANATDFLAEFDPLSQGCVILDIRMPGMSGTVLHQQLRQQGVKIPVVFISGHGDISMAVEAIKNGAFDFIEKPFREEHLLKKIDEAINTDKLQSQKLALQEAIGVRLQKLTPREEQVMQLVVAGKSNKMVASELGIARGTVEIHRSRIMSKMEAKNLPDLMKMLMEMDQLS